MKHKPKPILDPETVEKRLKQFAKETKKYSFVYKCVDCVHYDKPENSCSMGFPMPEELQKKRKEPLADEFCKYFEIL